MAPLQRPKSGTQTDQLQIQHFIHQHLLQKLYMSSKFNCDGCNIGGEGVRYRCSGCDFDLHEQCATTSHRIGTHLHPHHHLVLVNRRGDHSHVCDVCKGITNGLNYTCEVATCEFNVHTLCVQIPVTTGVPSLTSDHCHGGASTAALGGYNEIGQPMSNNQHMLINRQQHMQGTPMVTNGYNGLTGSQPMAVNHQQQMQGMPTVQMGGYSQPGVVNYQQKQGMDTTGLGGYQAVNNNQTHMINQQQPLQQGVPMSGFNGYQGGNNSQPVRLHHQQQQQNQGVSTTTYGGYMGGRIVNL